MLWLIKGAPPSESHVSLSVAGLGPAAMLVPLLFMVHDS